MTKSENKFTKGQDAELPAPNAECWIRAKYIEKNNFENLVEIFDGLVNKHVHIQDSDLHFTKPQTQGVAFTEPNFTNKLKVGDKVQLVERWGRKPKDLEYMQEYGIVLNGTYIVDKVEDSDFDVRIKHGDNYWYVSFIFLKLVEPAQKYWLSETDKTYSIYYRGEKDKLLVAMSLRKDLYTLAEAQEQCDKLNRKG